MEENKNGTAALSPQTHTWAETTCDTHRIKHKHINCLKKKTRPKLPCSRRIGNKQFQVCGKHAHMHTYTSYNCEDKETNCPDAHITNKPSLCSPPCDAHAQQAWSEAHDHNAKNQLRNKICLCAGECRRGLARAATLAWHKTLASPLFSSSCLHGRLPVDVSGGGARPAVTVCERWDGAAPRETERTVRRLFSRRDSAPGGREKHVEQWGRSRDKNSFWSQ